MSDRTHLRGAKLLRDWREDLGLNQQEASDRIGIDLARYNAWENERARPGLDWAIRVEETTKGDVPAKSWTEESRKARAS